jgi:rRNA small subunit pseudouridine methyltransferase Nep1
MRGLLDADRRGRPDIAHMCLLLALDSPLNREGLLRCYVHTRHNKVITVDTSARLPRMSYRFEGLLEHLFLTGAAPPEKPLLHLESTSLADLLRRLKPKKVLTFTERGERKLLRDLFSGLSRGDEVCTIIGGFPHGDFLSDVGKLSNELVSIDPEPLDAPTVLSRVINAYEIAFGIQELRLERGA